MAANSILVSKASLPRFVALEAVGGQAGGYLTLQVHGATPFLTFTASQLTRLAAHEVLYNVDEEGVVMLRAPNGRFWQRNSDGFIVADREAIPINHTSNPACYFKVFRLSDGYLLFQSLVDNRYIRRQSTSIPQHALHASATGLEDVHAALRVTSAVDKAVILPRYIMLRGDNNMYVGNHRESNIDWLRFNNDTPGLVAVHEVIPLVDGNVAILNINLVRFWRRSPNWIWADVSTLSSARGNRDCHFDVHKFSNTTVAFVSIANSRLLKRYTEFWVDMLCAIGTTINDPTTRLIVQEATLSRSLFNIRYLLELAEVTDIRPVLVGYSTMFNGTDRTTELEVDVSILQHVANSQTWSTSSTFSTSLAVEISAGVPEVTSVNGSITVSPKRIISIEMGGTITQPLQFLPIYKVQVPPQTMVRVIVECTTARCRIPFTYTSRDTRIDGIHMPAEDNVDGIFEGANAFNIQKVVSIVEDNADRTLNILPVSITNA